MFVTPLPLFTSRGTLVISIVSLTRPQIHYLIRRSTSVIQMVFQHFGSVLHVHHVYLSWLLGERDRRHLQSWAKQLLHCGRHGIGGGLILSSQLSVSCFGICEITSWNLGIRTT